MQHTASESPSGERQAGPGLIESIWRYRWLVAAITILAAAAAYGLSFLQTPTYEAQARLLLADPASAGLFEETSGEGGERFLANQAVLANSIDVHALAADRLDDDATAEYVASRVEVSSSEDVDVLTVEAEGRSPGRAAALANAVAAAYRDLRASDVQQRAERSTEQLRGSMTALQERVDAAEETLQANGDAPLAEAERDAAFEQIATLETRIDEIAVDAALFGSGVERLTEARPPTTQSTPQPRRNAAVGLVLGMMAASGFAWLRAERVQSARDRQDPAEVLQAPLLAQIPEYKSVGVTGLDPARSAPGSVAAESYQFLMSALEYALAGTGGQSVVVTSAGPTAGKTLTALNLAIAATRDGRRVVLCDGDERTHGLTALTGVAPAPGLTDLADEQVPIEGAIAMLDVPSTPGLALVSAGTPPIDPAGFFRTAGFRTAMDRLNQRGSLVIVDAPPLLSVSDTSAIASQVDGIVVVVARGTDLRTLQEARERLDFVGTPVLGYVFNRASGSGASHYGYGAAKQADYAANGRPQAAARLRSGSYLEPARATDAGAET